jgi:hypothetical protein
LGTIQGDTPSRCAIYGMPGIGKTQLFLKFARSSFDQQRYSYIFWISATTIDKLNQGFAKVLDLINHPDRHHPDQSAKLTAARLWLEKCSRKWLLNFDNVDRETVNFLRMHLPRKNVLGNILFTTRSEDVATALVNAAGMQYPTYLLRALDVQDTVNLLLADAGVDVNKVTRSVLSKAEDLVGCIGRLPLAVAQAGTFMKQSQMTIDDLLCLYQGDHKLDVS